MAEFGYHTIGATDDNPGNNVIWCKATSTPASNGTLTDIFVYCRIRLGTPTVNAAIYSDSAGQPNTKIAEGTAQTVPGSAGWLQIPISASITSGTQYWLAVAIPGGGGTADMWAQFDTNGSVTENYYLASGPPGNGTFPTTASFTGNFADERWSIYGVYTPSGTSISIPAGSLVFTGLAAAPTFAFNLSIPAGAVVWTGLAPSVSLSGATSIAIPAGAVVWQGYAAQALSGVSIAIPAGSLAWTGQFVAIQFGSELVAGAIVWTGYAPVVNVQAPGQIQIPIPVGAYAFTGYAPVRSIGMNIDIPVGSLVWQGYALTLDAPRSIAIPAGSLVWTGRVLSVLNGGRLPQGDLTSQVAIWMRTLPAGGNINTRIRDAICTLYGLNPNITDITPAFARFTRDRN